jgi:hypothetical protein
MYIHFPSAWWGRVDLRCKGIPLHCEGISPRWFTSATSLQEKATVATEMLESKARTNAVWDTASVRKAVRRPINIAPMDLLTQVAFWLC